jgi:peptidoglycan/LPS O-acetylase OafA/YrhL
MMKFEPGRDIRPRDYLPSLDGWRAVAILWVMQAHGPAWSVGWISNRWINANGDRGVQLFFALSGVLICTRLLREEKRFGAISLRSFYTRRLFRIQPAALVYLAVIALLMVVGMAPVGWKGIAGAVAMIRNVYPARGGTWETQHFWSLAAEEHFYLFLPGFLVLWRQTRLAVMSALVVGFELWRIVLLGHPRLHGARIWRSEFSAHGYGHRRDSSGLRLRPGAGSAGHAGDGEEISSAVAGVAIRSRDFCSHRDPPVAG